MEELPIKSLFHHATDVGHGDLIGGAGRLVLALPLAFAILFPTCKPPKEERAKSLESGEGAVSQAAPTQAVVPDNAAGLSWVLHSDDHVAPEREVIQEMFRNPESALASNIRTDVPMLAELTPSQEHSVDDLWSKPINQLRDSFEENLVSTLRQLKGKAEPVLNLFIASHGGKGFVCQVGRGGIGHKDLVSVLYKHFAKFNKTGQPLTVNLTYQACYSGSFIDELRAYLKRNPSNTRMNVLTSASSRSVALGVNHIGSFMLQSVRTVNKVIAEMKEQGLSVCSECTPFQRMAKIMAKSKPDLGEKGKYADKTDSVKTWSTHIKMGQWPFSDYFTLSMLVRSLEKIKAKGRREIAPKIVEKMLKSLEFSKRYIDRLTRDQLVEELRKNPILARLPRLESAIAEGDIATMVQLHGEGSPSPDKAPTVQEQMFRKRIFDHLVRLDSWDRDQVGIIAEHLQSGAALPSDLDEGKVYRRLHQTLDEAKYPHLALLARMEVALVGDDMGDLVRVYQEISLSPDAAPLGSRESPRHRIFDRLISLQSYDRDQADIIFDHLRERTFSSYEVDLDAIHGRLLAVQGLTGDELKFLLKNRRFDFPSLVAKQGSNPNLATALDEHLKNPATASHELLVDLVEYEGRAADDPILTLKRRVVAGEYPELAKESLEYIKRNIRFYQVEPRLVDDGDPTPSPYKKPPQGRDPRGHPSLERASGWQEIGGRAAAHEKSIEKKTQYGNGDSQGPVKTHDLWGFPREDHQRCGHPIAAAHHGKYAGI